MKRVIIAIILLLFGFGLWGLHREIGFMRSDLNAAGKAIVNQLGIITSSMGSTKDRVDQIYKLSYGKATIHKARKPPPVKYLPPKVIQQDIWGHPIS